MCCSAVGGNKGNNKNQNFRKKFENVCAVCSVCLYIALCLFLCCHVSFIVHCVPSTFCKWLLFAMLVCFGSCKYGRLSRVFKNRNSKEQNKTAVL